MTSPLPSFTWADGRAVWKAMIEKDGVYSRRRNPRMLEAHPSLVSEFRTILLDWLSEVAAACRFHRETYHLAVDFTDRYLSAEKDINKLELQLIGTTCLFIAAKFEEIRPPTVFDFAELTDGAYNATEIISKEIVILGAIRWNITPLTANSWLNTYLQLLASHSPEAQSLTSSPTKAAQSATNIKSAPETSRETCDSLMIPKANPALPDQKKIECLVDLALLDLGSLQFSYSVLAAAALYFFTDMATVQLCTGLTFSEIRDCVIWIEPFAEMARLVRVPPSSPVANKHDSPSAEVEHTEIHQLHHHLATKALLERVHERRASSTLTKILVPADTNSVLMSSPEKPSPLLTPPRSTKKRRVMTVNEQQQHYHHSPLVPLTTRSNQAQLQPQPIQQQQQQKQCDACQPSCK